MDILVFELILVTALLITNAGCAVKHIMWLNAIENMLRYFGPFIMTDGSEEIIFIRLPDESMKKFKERVNKYLNALKEAGSVVNFQFSEDEKPLHALRIITK